MNMTVCQGAAFVALYVLMLTALVRPQMNFKVFVNSFFLRADSSSMMILTYRFDIAMAMFAGPLSAVTVYALTQWNKEGENPSARKMLITGVVCAYILVLVANFLANGLVLQKTLHRFDQCPHQAWYMYRQMAMSFVETVLADARSLITKQIVKRPRLIYHLH